MDMQARPQLTNVSNCGLAEKLVDRNTAILGDTFDFSCESTAFILQRLGFHLAYL